VAATKEDIRRWLTEPEAGAEFVIVVCDTYDWDDYPVYCTAEDFERKYQNHNGPNMTKVMEVYDLSMDIEIQLNEHRAYHFPKEN
jgi:hypothetical protein